MKTIYHASFEIGSEEYKPNLDNVLKVIDEWASRRTNSCVDFRRITEETHLDFPEASLDIVKLSREDTSLSSLVLRHNDKEDEEFKWCTDVKIRDKKGFPHKASITVSNGWQGVALRPDIDYKFSRPAIVPMLVEKFNCHNFRQLFTHPEVLARENVSSLVNSLYSRHRTLPIILVTRNLGTEKPIVNPFEIAKSVVGLAHVFYCKDKLVPFQIEKSIGKSMSCYDGGIRVYWPISARGTNPSFHPIITAQKLKEDEARARNINLELLEMLSKESISRAAEVSDEEVHEMRLKNRAKVLTENQDYQELAELYAADNTRLSEETNKLKQREEKLQQQVQTLEARIAVMQAGLKSKKKDEDENLTQLSFSSVEEAVNKIKEIYSEDQLQILGRAEKGAKKCMYDKPEFVFKGLEWLATTYRSAKKGEIEVKDLDISCRNQTGLQYLAHQSESTMGQFENEYYVDYGGRKIALKEHLKKGTSKDPRNAIRIAFFYDTEKEKVVVGFIGRHQTTKAT
jgi:hypothetical protein